MLIAFVALGGGLVLLTLGADRFIDGAAAIAWHFDVPAILVGLVIVGFATSAPEMLVSAVAAYRGSPTLGVGNAVGSNIANVGLVLGATALIMPLTVRSTVLRREFPMMLVVLVFASSLLLDLELDRVDGAALIAGMVAMIGGTVWLALHVTPGDPLIEEFDQEFKVRVAPARAVLLLAVGLVLLLVGSEILVTGAVDLARHFGVSDVVIGLTIVAIGTSLPELAASVMSALKNEPDIALGNVIGSNMFNALGVLAMPALIAPCRLDPELIERDIPYMLVLSVALFMLARGRGRPGTIGRLDGGILLTGFLAYQAVLLFSVR